MTYDRSAASERWKYFVDVALWPRKVELDPEAWLNNFHADELPLAIRLLEGFVYFSNDLVKQMFRAAFLNSSQSVVVSKGNYVLARSEWITCHEQPTSRSRYRGKAQ